MQTHEDPEARRRFDIVNQVLGWGNPRAPIWFIGLEEAEQWNKDPNKDKEGYVRYSKCVDGWLPVLEGEIEKQAADAGKKYTKIYNIMSKLILQITRGNFTEWKSYRNKKLFVDACQTNLYPLARPHHNEWPKHYKCLFGFGENPDDQRRYEQVADARLSRIRKDWQKAEPRITFCFGKTRWDQFKKVLLLGEAYEPFDGCELLSSGIVLTPFFNPRFGMTEVRIKKLAERLHPLWLGSTSQPNQL